MGIFLPSFVGLLPLPLARLCLRWRAGVLLCCLIMSQLACTDSTKSPALVEATDTTSSELPIYLDKPDFGISKPSPEVSQMADGILRARDQGRYDFFIVDKKLAKLYVFSANGMLRGESAILLGSARGDDSVPGIGTRPLNKVRPNERTTPAGRFVAERGENLDGEDIIWVDYDAALSMHRVRAKVSKERRLERLSTPSAKDNRISFGCVNIPTQFYETVVSPIFARSNAVVYILPEVKPLQQAFSFDVSRK